MKGLNTLIKLQKRKLDALRRTLASLESQKSQLQQAILVLQKELEEEIILAAKQVEMAHFFGDFSKRIKNRQLELTQEIRKIDKQITALRDEITEAYGEQKKYEIAKENALQRQRQEATRKETIELDEIAAQQFQRKQQEET